MFDKNNNISLILIVLFIIIIIVYYNKNYNNRICKLNKKIENFKTEDLKDVSRKLSEEITQLDSVKDKIKTLKTTNKSTSVTIDGNATPLSAIKDLNTIDKDSKDLYKHLDKIKKNEKQPNIKDTSYLDNIRERTQEFRLSKLHNEIKNLKQRSTSPPGSDIKRIKNPTTGLNLNVEINNTGDYYNIYISDIDGNAQLLYYNKSETPKYKLVDADEKNGENSDINKYVIKFIDQYKNYKFHNQTQINPQIKKEWEKIKDSLTKKYPIKVHFIDNIIKIIEENLTIQKSDTLQKQFQDHNLFLPKLSSDVTKYDFIINPNYLLFQIIKISEEDSKSCFRADNEVIPCEDPMSKKKDTQLFICNYNTHVNFPHQIDKTMVDNEQVVKEFYVIKPHPDSSNFVGTAYTEIIEYGDDYKFINESNYLENDYLNNDYLNNDYLTTLYQTDSRIEDNDTTYQEKCTDIYMLQKDHRDCLTVDSDGISFQECILRPNQMWSVYYNEASC
jgi:hypothetical protein